MFSGIIETAVPLSAKKNAPGGIRLELPNPFSREPVLVGESIAVEGVCLTSEPDSTENALFFFVSPETLDRTTLGTIPPGTPLNLERSVSLSQRLSGHLVQGHVDGVGTVAAVEHSGESHRLSVQVPKAIAKYMVEKGSVAINGVSLTINHVDDDEFTTIHLMIIPHTWTVTSLSSLKPGSLVNLESDIVAKYVERLCRN